MSKQTAALLEKVDMTLFWVHQVQRDVNAARDKVACLKKHLVTTHQQEHSEKIDSISMSLDAVEAGMRAVWGPLKD